MVPSMIRSMMNVGLLAAALLAASGCASGNAPSASSGASKASAPAAVTAVTAVARAARPWSEAERSWINGQASLAKLRGQVVLVEAWHPT